MQIHTLFTSPYVPTALPYSESWLLLCSDAKNIACDKHWWIPTGFAWFVCPLSEKIPANATCVSSSHKHHSQEVGHKVVNIDASLCMLLIRLLRMKEIPSGILDSLKCDPYDRCCHDPGCPALVVFNPDELCPCFAAALIRTSWKPSGCSTMLAHPVTYMLNPFRRPQRHFSVAVFES